MKVNYDSRAVTYDGERQLILSGAIHYPRSTPAMWRDLMKKSKDAGLNTIESYLFWNFHEPKKREYDFSGRLDLLRFIEEADREGLKFILRIGPYICAEINYGGFPLWLREEDNVKFRTWNESYMREMEHWTRYICDMVEPYQATNGGPIILAQIENEYVHMQKHAGKDGERYIEWARDLTKELNLDIPWFMCYGAPKGILETINDFNPHAFIDGTADDYFKHHPNEPALCTELWSGWIDVYGEPRHSRTPESLAYSSARFLAAGGTGINYYMWHGGTNFNREQMFLQTTSYDYDAPLDEYGNRTTKYNHLKDLHKVILKYQDYIIENNYAKPMSLGESVFVYKYEKNGKSLMFFCNDHLDEDRSFVYDGNDYSLSPISVQIYFDHKMIFDTHIIDNNAILTTKDTIFDGNIKIESTKSEHIPIFGTVTERENLKICRDYPAEQLSLTKDESDYCWYTTQISISKSNEGMNSIKLEGVADYVYIYIDGNFVIESKFPTLMRGPISGDGFDQSFDIELSAGTHAISILCCSAGLIKNNSLIGNDNMSEERKGLWRGISLNDARLSVKWEIIPGGIGEGDVEYFLTKHCSDSETIDKSKNDLDNVKILPTWWKLSFDNNESSLPLLLELSGMSRGVIWLNSKCVGRYWIVDSMNYGNFKPNDPTIKVKKIGSPSQTYYHLPAEWLDKSNSLIIFDEKGAKPVNVKLYKRDIKELEDE